MDADGASAAAVGALGMLGAGAAQAAPVGATPGKGHAPQMGRRDIGPREIMGQLAYEHAIEVTNPTAWLMITGHESRNEAGEITNRGDIAAQAVETLHQIRQTVAQAGWKMSDIVQTRIFVTDIDAMTKAYGTFLEAVNAEGIRMTSTMIEVAALSDPDMLVEIDAIAVR